MSDIVGLVSGLTAIFTFFTGVTSANQLRRHVAAARRSRLRLILAMSIPVFGASMAVTLARGMNGDDTGGTQFLLLLIGALLLWLYAARLGTSVPWPLFLLGCAAGLCGIGLLFGAISAGEEAEGASAGMVIGAGIGLLAPAFRGRRAPAGEGRSDGTPARRPEGGVPHRAEVGREREILALARRQEGEVTVGDVALETSLSLAEARDTLERLAASGFCERAAAPSGAVHYRFADFRPR